MYTVIHVIRMGEVFITVLFFLSLLLNPTNGLLRSSFFQSILPERNDPHLRTFYSPL